MARAKICGLRTRETWLAATDAGADWVGFVFFPRSPRFVTIEALKAIGADGRVPRVGLFVAPTPEAIETVLKVQDLEVLQIYAGAKECRAMRARFGARLWRAVGVSSTADLPHDDEGLDGFVIESKPPQGADRPGGNATAFDWAVMQGWRAPAPWLLAGGLTPANVAGAVRASGAAAVDVSSGVESAPGEKSVLLIRDFVAAAHAA
ncbi:MULTISPECIES: phosphoribosylanthranilate isomerase [unclassified Acidiphilium]|uniref:phosphoribosylanthranilate isomerase n=1 Tax=unclassified Acidiphilium TaxID=2617493 RepID=UPI000BD1BFFE|nr:MULTISPECIES: phosphoribosylanthranilate isomerase [unclassified Acidiphilium]OYV54839.1 MAG: N-(5'-phosphoribosyl)anthranilate isomerase [Acidiphilium sp. 20-67-58]HQT62320.1 phosphoribosylanthranilate isomerase [Acidiphilium sp.]